MSSEDDSSSSTSGEGESDIEGEDESRLGGDRSEQIRNSVPASFSSSRTLHAASGVNGGGCNVSKQASTLAPQKKDVLLGRGRPYQNFTGNRRMLRIVSGYKEEYTARPRDQKRVFVETVLDAVLQDGTRFLRRLDENDDGSDQWEEVDRMTAAEKVWHALRSKGRSTNGKKRRNALNKEGDGEEGSILSHTSGFKERQQQEQNILVSNDNASSNERVGGFLGSNVSPQPVQQRPEGRDRASASMIQSIESLTREIMQHLNSAVAATNLLNALIGAPQQLPSAPSPLMMVTGAPSTGGRAVEIPTQHSSIVADHVGVINQDMYRGVGQAPPPAVGPTPLNNHMPPAPLFPFTNLVGIASSPPAMNYSSALNQFGGGGGGGTASLSPAFQAALQAAQMAALYPRLYIGGDPQASVASSSSTMTTPTVQSTSDRNQQILLHALATLSRQSNQQGGGSTTQSGAPR